MRAESSPVPKHDAVAVHECTIGSTVGVPVIPHRRNSPGIERVDVVHGGVVHGLTTVGSDGIVAGVNGSGTQSAVPFEVPRSWQRLAEFCVVSHVVSESNAWIPAFRVSYAIVTVWFKRGTES